MVVLYFQVLPLECPSIFTPFPPPLHHYDLHCLCPLPVMLKINNSPPIRKEESDIYTSVPHSFLYSFKHFLYVHLSPHAHITLLPYFHTIVLPLTTTILGFHLSLITFIVYSRFEFFKKITIPPSLFFVLPFLKTPCDISSIECRYPFCLSVYVIKPDLARFAGEFFMPLNLQSSTAYWFLHVELFA